MCVIMIDWIDYAQDGVYWRAHFNVPIQPTVSSAMELISPKS